MILLFFQIIGVLYLLARFTYTLRMTWIEWKESRTEEPDLHDQTPGKKFITFFYLLTAMWFFLPLNLVASFQHEDEEEEEEHS